MRAPLPLFPTPTLPHLLSMTADEAAHKAKELLASAPDIQKQVEALMTRSAKALLEAPPPASGGA